MNVPFLDLKRINARDRVELIDAAMRVIDSGWYVLGEELSCFEQEFAEYCGTRYCVGVGSGLDALSLSLRTFIQLGELEPGDEVIVPANTFIATVLAVSESRLMPVFVDPDPDTYNLCPGRVRKAIGPRTRAMIPVHLYGSISGIEELRRVADDNGLLMVEDAAQAHGAMSQGRRAGSWGDFGAFSFYPGKVLGALGDAGAITTDRQDYAEALRAMRNYGSVVKYQHAFKGVNSRLDELHAAFLRVKLRRLSTDIEERRQAAQAYLEGIQNPLVVLPIWEAHQSHVFHLFVVLCLHRDELQAYLAENGVQTMIHYPISPYRQPAYSEWSEHRFEVSDRLSERALSLPIGPCMPRREIERVVELVNDFRPVARARPR